MRDSENMELVRDYARSNSEAAFAELVRRHIPLVYSAALRHTGVAAQAEEITQAVFIVLARKASSLRPGTVLEAWLYETTRLTALGVLRAERRRQFREQEAYMQSTLEQPTLDPAWHQVAPLLDDAMTRLGRKEREAVLLRFFKDQSLGEAAAELNISEAAAQKRVNRGLEKLRNFFTKRGVTLTAAVIAGAITTNSVHAAPAGLAITTAATAAKGSAVAASTITLAKETMKTITWMKMKFAINISAAVLLAGGAATVAISQTSAEGPTAREIVKKSQAVYTSLSSYGDEGETLSSIGATAVPPHHFTIKLARPGLYRIEWVEDMGFFKQQGAVWSAGNGNFMKIAAGGKPAKYPKMESALSSATGVSGEAAASIPGTFFNLPWGNQFGAAANSMKRVADAKIGDVDCYVLTQEKGGRKRTVWIGKQDYLIRQIEDDTSAATLKAELEAQAKAHPEFKLPMTTATGDVVSVQIHSNIVVNASYPASDFEVPPVAN